MTTNNYAETLVREANDNITTAEEFKEYFNLNIQELYSGSSETNNYEQKVASFRHLSSELPETSFKFSYIQDKTKSDPLEELGIEVVK